MSYNMSYDNVCESGTWLRKVIADRHWLMIPRYIMWPTTATCSATSRPGYTTAGPIRHTRSLRRIL